MFEDFLHSTVMVYLKNTPPPHPSFENHFHNFLFVLGKQYSRLDFIACLCMSVGLIFFTLADSEVSPNFNHTGKIFILIVMGKIFILIVLTKNSGQFDVFMIKECELQMTFITFYRERQ